jgi:hypothetical protein
MKIIEKITNDVIYKLSQQPENKTPEIIRQLIAFESANPLNPVQLTVEQIEEIAKEIEHQFGLTMEEGTLIVDDENFEPWLHNKKSSENFEPYFWNRYEKLLLQNGFAPPVVSSIDNVTDKIVARLEDPDKEGPWNRRGMVVGHVQSGKTANFIGVINKASDVGYKLIIILAGMQETLRSQTQERVDEGYIGQDSSKKNAVDFSDSLIGVGHLNHDKLPYSFTTKHKDFDDKSNFIVEKYDDATILVVKKNARILEKLRDWLKKNNSNIDGTISNLPLLLIDDEADHASINTNDPEKDPTTINKRIREILNLFHRKCYLAYTATPFANIFIDPSNEDDMHGDDLFPKDFIISLDPPSNYVGSEMIFGDDTNLINIVRDIGDIEDIIPLKHKKNQTITCLPDSLQNAVYSHIISKAIRILRGQTNKHHSMLVHLSRYKDVQKEVFNLIVQLRQDIEKGVRYYYKLQKEEALHNHYMKNLYSIWEDDFSTIYSQWTDIQEKLLESVASMQVMLINGDSADSLEYKAYKNGLNVIAVGGDKLSRGLTLEGLATSYFYRSTSMYDTLMQMGRWFGYRDGFADLCRIYLTPMTESYFSHISNAVEELREELKEMFVANLTPKEFGLKVRTHPGALLITARNKMRASKTLLHRTDLSGRLVETYVVDLKPEHRKNNLNLFNEIVEKLQKTKKAEYNEASSNNYVWKHISANIVEEFIKKFDNHPRAQMTQTKPILSYLERATKYFPEWDIVFISSSKSLKESYSIPNSDLKVGIQKRTCNPKGQYEKDNYIEISTRRRVAAGTNDAERAGMSTDEIAEALEKWKQVQQSKAEKETEQGNSQKAKEILEKELKINSIPGRYLRRTRKRPLLMLHIVNAYKDIKDETTLVEDYLPAYGISFPKRDDIYIEPVEYAVNTTYVQNYYEEFEDDEE